MKNNTFEQPMNGFTDEQIHETRNRFLEFAKEEKLQVVNTFFTNQLYVKSDMELLGVINFPVSYLSKSLEKMSQCNIVYFAKGWENARGCKIEHEVALQYGLDIIYQ